MSEKKLQEKLLTSRKALFSEMSDEEKNEVFAFNEGYKEFLTRGKTERLCADEMVRRAKAAGFAPFDRTKTYQPGDKFYYKHRNRALVLGMMGQEPIAKGVNLVAAHIDSPRIDLKQNPLYEEEGLAFFKTHYYGGLKKYQWTALPLALYGVVALKDGSLLNIAIGDDPADPAFCITDLLPHLAVEQMGKKMSEAITGEGLNILIGSIPYRGEECKTPVKLNIMNLLYEKYGIVEEDFKSAELTAVPAGPARDIGLDRSMVGAYGQDDRVCAYTAAMALLGAKSCKRTALVVLADKEEIGSVGVSGMESRFFENIIADLAQMQGVETRHVLSKSVCLSADVNVAFDPNYADVSEKNNSAILGQGVALTKYTGSRGKSGSSDAGAELLGSLRRLFDDNKVQFQTGELGKVDKGGGGTVAQYLANLDIETVDMGVAVLSMHAPFEVVSKADVYMTYRAFLTFVENYDYDFGIYGE